MQPSILGRAQKPFMALTLTITPMVCNAYTLPCMYTTYIKSTGSSMVYCSSEWIIRSASRGGKLIIEEAYLLRIAAFTKYFMWFLPQRYICYLKNLNSIVILIHKRRNLASFFISSWVYNLNWCCSCCIVKLIFDVWNKAGCGIT